MRGHVKTALTNERHVPGDAVTEHGCLQPLPQLETDGGHHEARVCHKLTVPDLTTRSAWSQENKGMTKLVGERLRLSFPSQKLKRVLSDHSLVSVPPPRQ